MEFYHGPRMNTEVTEGTEAPKKEDGKIDYGSITKVKSII